MSGRVIPLTINLTLLVHVHVHAREDSQSEPVAPVAAQDEGARTKAQGSADAEAGSAAARRSVHHRHVDQFVTATGAGEGAPTPADPASVPDVQVSQLPAASGGQTEEAGDEVGEALGVGEATSHAVDPGPAPAPVASFSITVPSPADYRPHCRNRDVCAGVGLKHCFSCQKIADASLAEAA